MGIDARRFAIAAATSAAVLWLACAAVVGLAPGPAMAVTGDMFHADLSHASWSLSLGGVLTGLLGWTVSAAAATGLTAWVYNALVTKRPQE